MTSLDSKYRLHCTMDYDIFIEIFFPCINMTKYKHFCPTSYNLTGNNRATFDILLLPFVTVSVHLRCKGIS